MTPKRALFSRFDGPAKKRHDRLIPMINIVFLLLAFFIIAGTVRVAAPLAVAPPVSAGAGMVDSRSPTLLIDARGRLAYDGAIRDLDQAIALIVKRLEKDADAELHIKADRAVPVRFVLPVLDRLQAANITAVRLIAVKRRGGS
jgi:biopolymer transport protein ExbD